MVFELRAAVVVCRRVERSLSFADRLTNHQHYLILQRDEELPDEALPDLKNIYIERDDQGWGGYGGIARVILERNGLALHLTSRMASHLGGYETLRVTFTLDDVRFGQLKEVLMLIMFGYEDRLDA